MSSRLERAKALKLAVDAWVRAEEQAAAFYRSNPGSADNSEYFGPLVAFAEDAAARTAANVFDLKPGCIYAEALDALQWVVACCDPNGDPGLGVGMDTKDMEHAIERAKQVVNKAKWMGGS